jgi:hypothetical protein
LANQIGPLKYQSMNAFPSFINNSPQMSSSTLISNEIEDAKQIRQFKMDALKDKQFLNDEKDFIQTLKASRI